MKKLLSIVAILFVSTIGCTQSTTSVPVTPPAAAEEIKMGLKSMAESGVVDSGMVSVQEKIEELKAQDSAKGTEIAEIFAKLQAAKSPADVKKHASAILDKLK